MSKPLVSIIILNYNGKYLSSDCINSILKSNYKKFEIILLDNGSTDKSFEFLKKKFKRNSNIKIIRSAQNLYIAGGDNFAASFAVGQKLIFMNNDIIVNSDWLTELLKCSKRNSRYIVQPKILFYDKKNVIDQAGGYYTFYGFGMGRGHDEKDRGQYNKNGEIDFAFGTTMLIDRSLYDRLGGFDEEFKFYYEDVDLNLRAKKLGGKAFFCYKAVVYHKVSQTVKKIQNLEFIDFNIRRNRLRTIIKNFTGVNKILRVLLTLTIYLYLIFHDVIRLRFGSAAMTIKAVSSNFSHNKSSPN